MVYALDVFSPLTAESLKSIYPKLLKSALSISNGTVISLLSPLASWGREVVPKVLSAVLFSVTFISSDGLEPLFVTVADA